MKLLPLATGIFSLFIFSAAHAIQITDVKTFNQTFEYGGSFDFSYNLADYGFDPERDRLVGEAILTFEFRDLNYSPDKDFIDRPFISLFIDQGRSFMRIYDEDWVVDNGLPWFNEAGIMHPYLQIEGENTWLGNVTLNFEFTPGPETLVPEPLPVTLMGIGLLAIVMRRYKMHAKLNH